MTAVAVQLTMRELWGFVNVAACSLKLPAFYNTTRTARKLASKTLHNKIIHSLAQRLNTDVLNNFMRKSKHKHQSRFALINAS